MREFLRPSNEVWGKVMFLHVCHSVLGIGGLCMMSLPIWLPGPRFLPGGLCLWSHVLGEGSVQGVCVWRTSVWRSLSMGVSVHGVSVQGDFCPGGLCPEGLCPGGLLSREVSVRENPPDIQWRACSMHPTGMHSCLKIYFQVSGNNQYNSDVQLVCCNLYFDFLEKKG